MRPSQVPIRTVLVTDDSSQSFQLVQALQRGAGIAVLGVATTGPAAIALVADALPDVVVLDLHLADGSSKHTIEHLMGHTPTPILVLTGATEDRHCASAVEALQSGALEALPRSARWTPEPAAELRRMVYQISKVRAIRHPRGNRADSRPPVDPHPARGSVVGIGASTGGPSALATILSGLDALDAPILVVQHLHPDFTGGLLEWMGRVCALPVLTAAAGQVPLPGRVYLAPGGFHLRLGTNKRLELNAAPVTIHRPSADQLFESLAQLGPSAIGVLLTGMGEDGARGLLAIRRGGGQTLAQDEATSAVFGMPRAAQRLGAVDDLLPLDQLAGAITRAVAGVRV